MPAFVAAPSPPPDLTNDVCDPFDASTVLAPRPIATPGRGRSKTMRSAMLNTSRRIVRRELLLGGFTLAMAVVGIASLAVAALAGTGADLRLPGGAVNLAEPSTGPSLVAIGYGEASAPAEQASLQILIGPSSYEGGLVAGMPEAGGEPGEAERQAVEPIVRALRGAGVAEGDIGVVVSPALATRYFGPGGGFGVRLDIAVRQPTPERLNALVDAAGVAAETELMVLAEVGAGYLPADCADLERLARERAIEDARRTAKQQAQLLGTTLGGLHLSSDVPPSEQAGAGTGWIGCNAPSGAVARSPYDSGAVTVPAFNPTDPAEARAVVAVSLTYALPEA